jgi:GNAT superfamily N-acetyltransferase
MRPLPAGFVVRVPRADDTDGLGQLFFDCQVPGAELAGVAEGIEENRAFFRGEFGEFWPAGSGVIEFDGRLVAALLAVRRAVWDGTPDCPFVTDLFTEPAYRRHGLARALLARCLNEAGAMSRPRIALRADDDNVPAMRLYESLGFRRYDG